MPPPTPMESGGAMNGDGARRLLEAGEVPRINIQPLEAGEVPRPVQPLEMEVPRPRRGPVSESDRACGRKIRRILTAYLNFWLGYFGCTYQCRSDS